MFAQEVHTEEDEQVTHPFIKLEQDSHFCSELIAVVLSKHIKQSVLLAQFEQELKLILHKSQI